LLKTGVDLSSSDDVFGAGLGLATMGHWFVDPSLERRAVGEGEGDAVAPPTALLCSMYGRMPAGWPAPPGAPPFVAGGVDLALVLPALFAFAGFWPTA
jgi:hypothetical protein